MIKAVAMRIRVGSRFLVFTLLSTGWMAGFGLSHPAFSAQPASEKPAGSQASKNQGDGPTQRDIFVAGKDGYASYRIPSLLVTRLGTVLAICEGRKRSSSDSGDIDLVQRRSLDGGNTWVRCKPSPTMVNIPSATHPRSSIVETGTIWMLMTRNNGQDKEPQILAETSREPGPSGREKHRRGTHLVASGRDHSRGQTRGLTWYATPAGSFHSAREAA